MGAAEGVATTLLDHNVILSITTLLWAFPPMIVDGPFSRNATFVMDLAGLDEASYTALHGSKQPSVVHLLLWRFRVPIYLVLRAAVTQGFSEDPLTLLVPQAKKK